MKHLFCILASILSLSAFCEDVSEDGFVYVDVPTGCRAEYDGFMFGEIDIRMKRISIDDNSHYTKMDLKSAMSKFASSYNTFRQSQKNAGISDAIAEANMPYWCDYMQYVFSEGYARQLAYDLEKKKDEQGATENALEDVQKLSNEASKRIAELNSIYPAASKTVAGLLALSQSAISAAVSDVKESLESKIAEGLKTDDDRADAAEYGARLAELETKVAKIAEMEKKLENVELSVDAMANISISTTNSFIAVARWLGNTNKNVGVFLRPKSPFGGDYSDGQTILDNLSDLGYVTYLSDELIKRGVLGNRISFNEEVADQGTTNVIATFGAPKNWAGAGVDCTNGTYSIREPITWVTNITEDVEARNAIADIYTNALKRIVVTNLIDNSVHMEFVTNIVFDQRKTEVITNLFDNSVHMEFTTNIVFNDNHREFITNVFDYSQAITNFYIVAGFTKNGDDPTPRPPEMDPYNPEYEEGEHPETDNLLPVENARMIVAITNAPWSKIKPGNAFVKNCLWSNSTDSTVRGKIEIRGFTDAGKNDDEGLKGGYFPLKRKDAIRVTTPRGSTLEDGIVWEPFPFEITNVVELLTNDVDTIKESLDLLKILKRYGVNSIINNNITMMTNLFDVVSPDRLLDNESVWTNTDRRIEIKGFKGADDEMIPVKHIGEDAQYVEWKPIPKNDGSVGGGETMYSSIEQMCEYPQCVEPGVDSTNVFTVAGFPSAPTNAVPVKVRRDLPFGEIEYGIEWKPYGVGGMSVKSDSLPSSHEMRSGETYVNPAIGKRLVFRSAQDSNVKIDVSTNAVGDVILTFGVYYNE